MQPIYKHRADVSISLTFEAILIAVAIVIAGCMISTSLEKHSECNCPIHGRKAADAAEGE